jgi:MFS family permease
VWVLGAASLITDISSEMVVSILPVYLMFQVQASPAAIGLIEGMYQGGASLVRLASAVVIDRLRRYKELAIAGYAASAFAKLGFLLVGTHPTGLGAVVLADRLGKGIRTSPRDALISFNATPPGLGAAFGVHRALDTTGAVLGPVVAFALLRRAPQAYDAVFVTSFAIALVGVAVIAAFVRNPGDGAAPLPQGVSVRRVASLVADARVRRVVIAATVLGMVTISDSLVYLVLQRRTGLPLNWVPLLYVATPAAFAAAAIPMGLVADRIGRGAALLVGYIALLGVYVVLMGTTGGLATAAVCVVLLGIHHAATDGVLPALASGILAASHRATGLAAVATGFDLGRLVAAAVFGLVWSLQGVDAAVVLAATVLLVTLAAGSRWTRRLGDEPA